MAISEDESLRLAWPPPWHLLISAMIPAIALALIHLSPDYLSQTLSLPALLLVLLVPGYLMTLWAFPGKSDLTIEKRGRLLFAASLLLAGLFSLLLMATPRGLQYGSLATILSLLSIFLAGLAYFRWSDLPRKRRFLLLPKTGMRAAGGRSLLPQIQLPELRRGRTALAALLLLICFVAALIFAFGPQNLPLEGIIKTTASTGGLAADSGETALQDRPPIVSEKASITGGPGNRAASLNASSPTASSSNASSTASTSNSSRLISPGASASQSNTSQSNTFSSNTSQSNATSATSALKKSAVAEPGAEIVSFGGGGGSGGGSGGGGSSEERSAVASVVASDVTTASSKSAAQKSSQVKSTQVSEPIAAKAVETAETEAKSPVNASENVRGVAGTGTAQERNESLNESAAKETLKEPTTAPMAPSIPAQQKPAAEAAGSQEPGQNQSTESDTSIKSDAVGSNSVGSNAIDSGAVSSNAVSSSAIKSSAIESNAIESNAIESGPVESSAVDPNSLDPNANQPPRLSALVPDRTSPQEPGTPIFWRAEASDKEGDRIFYKFLLDGAETGKWSKVNSWSWLTNGLLQGEHTITVLVRDGSHSSEDSFDDMLNESFALSLPNRPPVLSGLNPQPPGPQPAGASITWTAETSDPEGDPVYFRFMKDGIQTRDWSTSATWIWDTSDDSQGDHRIQVQARDGLHASSDGSDSSLESAFTLTAPNSPPELLSLQPDAPGPKPGGSIVTWTASASDPEGDELLYKFQVDGSDRGDAGTWSESNTWRWDTSSLEVGVHRVTVLVRDGNHASEDSFDSSLEEEFSISGANQPPTLISLSSDVESPQAQGVTVTWRATAQDPDGDPILYRFQLNGKSMGRWSETATWKWSTKGLSARDYSIRVLARDGLHEGEDSMDSSLDATFTLVSEIDQQIDQLMKKS